MNPEVSFRLIVRCSLSNLTLTQQLVPNSCRLQDVPVHSNVVALTTGPVTAESELDEFEFGDDSTTLTSVEQSRATDVVLWNYHTQRVVRAVSCFVGTTGESPGSGLGRSPRVGRFQVCGKEVSGVMGWAPLDSPPEPKLSWSLHEPVSVAMTHGTQKQLGEVNTRHSRCTRLGPV